MNACSCAVEFTNDTITAQENPGKQILSCSSGRYPFLE